MRRILATVGRLLLAAALAYLIVGIVWETAFNLAAVTPGSPSDIPAPWEGLISFLAWFVLPSVSWPSRMSESIPGGSFIAITLFVGMTALMFGALTRLAPDAVPATGPRRPPKRRSPPRARAGRPRTS